MTEHMTERVTIDVDPDVVRVLREAADDVALDFATLGNLAAAIEAALPQPEPTAASLVRAYLRAADRQGDTRRLYAPRATHSHEQGEAVPECQTGPAGRSEARNDDAPDCPYARETTPGHWLCEPWPNDVPCQGCPRRRA